MDRQTLIAWLNNAHAMERELLPILRDHANDFRGMPAAQQRFDQHVRETEQHADRVREAIELLGGQISSLKTGSAIIAGNILSISTAMFSDELIKNALMDYGAEQFEVGSYTALVAAAEELGETEVADLCRANLDEDHDMADWILERIPKVVQRTLHEEAVAND
jgi:ferritin-like metal-binding protein YciE